MSLQTDVIVIGGGLSGLAAAYELERHQLRYTLIEVKPRLGGGILSTQQNGFVLDGGVFAVEPYPHWATLHDLELSDSLQPLSDGRMYFASGTQTLTDALAARLTGRVITRMAVTGIGEDSANGGYTVCLENGLALSARAVIVAVSARYAERIFRSLAPTVSAALSNFHYDDITRLGLGYTAEQRPPVLTAIPDMVFCSLATTEHAQRVPTGGLLVQIALRVGIGAKSPEHFVHIVTDTLGWGMPTASTVFHWSESDPLTTVDNATLNAQLPEQVKLVGSCYGARTLFARTETARLTTRQVIASIGTSA